MLWILPELVVKSIHILPLVLCRQNLILLSMQARRNFKSSKKLIAVCFCFTTSRTNKQHRGEHIHHGYFTSPSQTKESAQIALINLLLSQSQLPPDSSVLDVGCGLGGTSRYLARTLNCRVTGITISPSQVKLARELARQEIGHSGLETHEDDDTNNNNNTISLTEYLNLGKGAVRFLELDAEKMGEYFSSTSDAAVAGTGKASHQAGGTFFDCVWISEAMSHLPKKPLFFQNAHALLRPGGKLIIADWFKAASLTAAQEEADIRPIEDGMLLPPLCTQSDYVRLAEDAGFQCFARPMDVSAEVARTWDISWSLVQSPALWAFAVSQGRDGLAFLQAFRAMRRGYANGTFRYAVMVFEKL